LRSKTLKFASIALAAGLVLAACGDDEDDAGADTTEGGSGTETTEAAGGSEGEGGTSEGAVVISGSSTVAPISSIVADEFNAAGSPAEITVDDPGTGDGFALFCEGETDISDASRPIKEEEAQACADAGIEFVELEVAFDGMAVLTSAGNDAVECLTFADLYALVGPESQGFANWSDAAALAGELGSTTELPDAPLDITAPGEESGTYDSFIELALADIGASRFEEGKLDSEDAAETTRPDYQASANDNAIVQGVEGSEGGLGWVGFAYAEEEGENLKKMPIAAEPGGECVEPSQETISDGSYPIARSLYIYVNKAKATENEAVKAYVDFYLDGLEGFVEETGYTNLPEDRIEAAKAAWEDMETGTRVEG